MYNARLTYHWKIWGLNGDCNLSVRNLTGAEYMADPDGNAYQPGPEREIFGSIKIRF